MIQQFKDLSIRVKISGFVIPSTIAFGVIMTALTLYFLNDYKETTLTDYGMLIEQVQVSQDSNQESRNPERLLVDISQKADEQIKSIGILFISFVIIVIVLATIGAMIISHLIGGPLQKVAHVLENSSADGADLTQRFPVIANDETGKVSSFLNSFLENIQTIIINLQGTTDQLNGTAQSIHNLMEVIHHKTITANETAKDVYTTAGDMNTDMVEISSVLEQSTQNIHGISSAVVELSGTVNEISQTAAKAHTNSEKTSSQMAQLEDDVHELETVAQNISKVTETIAEISEQVNLLALNATIEAARAGDAGKGFAVVANEIKELAHQTADAATEIQDRIDQVQRVSQTTISGIIEATRIVSDNSGMVSAIAAAVEEQTATVTEISQTLSEAAEHLDFSNNKVSLASANSSDIAEKMNSVTESIVEVDNAVLEIADASKTLKVLAVDSAQITQQFHTGEQQQFRATLKN